MIVVFCIVSATLLGFPADLRQKRPLQLVTVTAAMYTRALEVCVAQGLGGGKIYDALLIECARESAAERIYTFHLRDFRLLAPDLAERLTSP